MPSQISCKRDKEINQETIYLSKEEEAESIVNERGNWRKCSKDIESEEQSKWKDSFFKKWAIHGLFFFILIFSL